MKRLAIITTHPIQYNAPVFSLLAMREKIILKVFYTWGKSVLKDKFDPGFGKTISWDIPLLDGYEYSFIENVAKEPGSHHFKGIDNPCLIKDIKEWKADAILVYGWSFKSHLRVMRYFHEKIPVFFRGDSTSLKKKNNIQSLVRKYFLRWVYRHVDKAFYVGTNNRKYFLQYGLRDEALVFAPHAIDNVRFSDETGIFQQQANEWGKELGIKATDLVIVYAGKLEPVKNLLWLIEVIGDLKNDSIKLLLVGNGPLEKSLKEKTIGEPRFIFIDFQNQLYMPIVYRLGQVFILCSHSETWGLSVNEAMACGRAILINENCGCAIDLVKNDSNGFIFRSDDKVGLRKYIQQLADDKKLVKIMGNRSKEIVSMWNFEEVCKAIEKATLES